MVTRYDVISSRWSSHFCLKMHVFSTFSTIKVKLGEKMIQSIYLCVILQVKHKKLPFIAMLSWFLILDKIQDGDHCWWRQRTLAAPPPTYNIPNLVEKIKGFPLQAKSFRNTATYQKLWGGFRQSPVPLYQGGGMNLRVHPKVNFWVYGENPMVFHSNDTDLFDST